MKQTTLCYLENDGRYLMLHRTKKANDINHDKWIGVGGKFEAGETPEQCMLREVWEETGFTVTKWNYRGIVTFYLDDMEGEVMHLFSCLEWYGTQKECDEGDLAWIAKDKLTELPMWEGDAIFLKLVNNSNEPFFNLKLVYHGEKLISAEKDSVPLIINH
ncbi:MAG: 8-oxo-dGTP diphosphatase [Bacteroidales bacterium]|nr:8-oxo-dGTP diphosphatase [Bacteroidales bacterium]